MPDPNAGRFVWYELLTTDSDAAVTFYTAVLGWGTQVFEGAGGPYTMWTVGPQPIGGVMQKPQDGQGPPSWLGYVGVDDVDATARDAAGRGATTYVEPQDIPTVGRFAVLADPQGAAFALYKTLNPAAEPCGSPGIGQVSWHELATSDEEAARSFYTGLFGWQPAGEVDMGGGMMYRMFGYGGPPAGAIYSRPPEMPVSAWTYYVLVEDLDGKLALVRERGGTVIHGPMEVPGGDRVAICTDPQGAVFAMHSKAA